MPAFFGNSPSKASSFPSRSKGDRKGGLFSRTFDDGLEGGGGSSSFDRDHGDEEIIDVTDEMGNISVIIAKTFEAKTLPDGKEQIIEDTVYKRLNDGYIYTESKVRLVDNDVKEQQQTDDRNEHHHHDGLLTDIDLHEEREGCETIGITNLSSPNTLPYEYSQSHSSNSNDDENTNFMSVITEDHEALPRHQFVEEYLYDKDPKGLLQWEEQSKPLSPSLQVRNGTGWCPYEEATVSETDIDSIQLVKLNNRRLGWTIPKPSLRAVGWMNSLFHSADDVNHSFGDERSGGAPLELTNGRKSSDDEEDEESGKSKSPFGRKLICRTKQQHSRRCMVTTFAILMGVICTIIVVPLLVPKKLRTSAAASVISCVSLKVVMNIPDNQDTNKWSLSRVSDSAGMATEHSINNAFSEALNGDASRIYESCVQPGIYEFTISDSGGDGLGEDGKGGYYITADGITLGVSSFFFHEEKMTFELPFTSGEENTNGSLKNDTACTDDFYLAIKTDNKPEETSWYVVDKDTGDQVLAGGPYALPWAVYSRRACLPHGNYTFHMLDDGGDGIHGEDEKGFFVLSKDGETVIQSDGQFGSGNSTDFVLGDEAH